MKTAQQLTDKLSIGLSTLCAFHCLALPILLVLVPSLGALQFQNEIFHTLMVLMVIPASIFALTLGCKNHKRFSLLLIGVLGLISLNLAIFLGHDLVSEFGEKALTVLGSTLLVIAHWLNFRLCKQHQDCPCY